MLTSSFSTTHWWIAAAVSGIALAVAAQFLAATAKGRVLTALLPMAGAASVVVDSAVRDYEGNTPLALYTATMLGLTLCRIIFAGYLRRQREVVRSGQQMEPLTGKQTALFFLTFTAVVTAMAVVL
ncbi:hypothetical protein CIB93_35560 [Streptomyces sp. WZ.A104]|uniref:Integral membrane protein n=1 Tax=Streptomyces durocortorensis TaxID=2811104 RepID=A0ABY9VV12_9ACTN|nr:MULTISPECIES: hypothetical protein [Streptomyces]PCG81411.1 hypothetical protein CIB93_35560 [Streptomyces sp. WZ.A104]WNF26999.1 hypothetical protein RI138_09200 [Streptomyces durocortorensis]